MAALRSVRGAGGSSAEIDVVLSADAVPVLLHDLTVDRTTNGRGVAAEMTAAALQSLDAGAWFAPRFADERIPTLAEAIALAEEIDLVLEVEIKEKRALAGMLTALSALSPAAWERVMLISFDHAWLREAKASLGAIRTGGIVHERFADPVAVAQAANLDQLCIDLSVFHPGDARALHQAGRTIRCHAYTPARIAAAEAEGLGWRALLADALEAGLIDTLSGDDVGWLAAFAANPRA